jgi:ribosomal protein S18 acetylase RimI-like enzyme
MHLSSRSSNKEDDEFLFRLYASTRQEEVSAWGWSTAQQTAFLQMQFQAQRRGYAAEYPDADSRIILADDEPIGRILIRRTDRDMWLVDVAILPVHRSHGLGTTLLRSLIAESESGGQPLKLQVAKGNRAARLYERLGFSKISEDQVYIQMEWNPNRRIHEREAAKD